MTGLQQRAVNLMIDMLTYQNQRNQIISGDAIAFKGKGMLSRAIQRVSKSPYSHVALLIWVKFHEEQRLMLAHAVFPSGVVFVHASRYLQHYKGDADLLFADHRRLEKEVPDYQGRLADFAALQAGRKYGTSGVLSFILPFSKDKASEFFCSKLLAAAWQNIGQMTDTDLRPDQIVEDRYVYPLAVSLD